MATTTATPVEDPKKYQLILANVRLSYPHLFVAQKSKDKPEDPGKFSASFLLDKEADKVQIATIKTKIEALLKEKNKGAKLAPNLLCLRDGDEFKPDAEGYAGMMFITSSNGKRPSVKDKATVRDAAGKLVDIPAGDPRIFGGCYVNVVLNLWFQDNTNGKRVNASLESVQYVRPGDAFGTPPVDADEAFGSLGQPETDEADML